MVYRIKRYHQVSKVYRDLSLDRIDLFFLEKIPIHTNSLYSSLKVEAALLVLTYYRTL